MEFIDDDELIEITPGSIRLRKRNLRENDRKRSERETADESSTARTLRFPAKLTDYWVNRDARHGFGGHLPNIQTF